MTGSRSSATTSSIRSERSAAPRLAVDAQEIAAHQLFQPSHAPAALLQVGGEAAIAVDGIVRLDHRIDVHAFAGRGDARLDPLERPFPQTLLGLGVQQ